MGQSNTGCFKILWDTLCMVLFLMTRPFAWLISLCIPRTLKCIKGEIVLITGAGQGLGKELALKLAELGPILVLWDINQENNMKVAEKIRQAGHVVHAYQVDVTNPQEVIDVVVQVKKDVGHVSILVNNAGVFSGYPIVDLPEGVLRRCFEVNVISHFTILQQFLPRMMELDKGHIVSIASVAGHFGTANMTDYCASKFAAVGLMDSLYMELKAAKKNIKLTTINPVVINTGLISSVKTRFPCLMPVLNVDHTAQKIVEYILSETEEVFIPKKTKYLISFTECFSRKTRFKIFQYIDYGMDKATHPHPYEV